MSGLTMSPFGTFHTTSDLSGTGNRIGKIRANSENSGVASRLIDGNGCRAKPAQIDRRSKCRTLFSKDSSSSSSIAGRLRRLEGALCHAGATVFAARVADETTDIMQRYRAHLVAMDSHNAEEVFNDNVALEAFHSLERASVCDSDPFLRRVPLCLPGGWISRANICRHRRSGRISAADETFVSGSGSLIRAACSCRREVIDRRRRGHLPRRQYPASLRSSGSCSLVREGVEYAHL